MRLERPVADNTLVCYQHRSSVRRRLEDRIYDLRNELLATEESEKARILSAQLRAAVKEYVKRLRAETVRKPRHERRGVSFKKSH